MEWDVSDYSSYSRSKGDVRGGVCVLVATVEVCPRLSLFSFQDISIPEISCTVSGTEQGRYAIPMGHAIQETSSGETVMGRGYLSCLEVRISTYIYILSINLSFDIDVYQCLIHIAACVSLPLSLSLSLSLIFICIDIE